MVKERKEWIEALIATLTQLEIGVVFGNDQGLGNEVLATFKIDEAAALFRGATAIIEQS